MPSSAPTANGNRAEEGIRAIHPALPNSPGGEKSGLAGFLRLNRLKPALQTAKTRIAAGQIAALHSRSRVL